MAITDLADFKERLDHPPNEALVQSGLGANTPLPGRWISTFTLAPVAGAAPSTAVAPTSATLGAYPMVNGSSGALTAIGAKIGALSPGVFMLVDRLSHQGGLSGIVTTSQVTNLPTAALTRYTDGVGVMCALQIYGTLGTTASTATVTYTNTVPTAAQASRSIDIGATGRREAGRILMVPPVAGDRGFKSVESVIINTTSTGTAGNFGVLLFKPLAIFFVDSTTGQVQCDLISGGFAGGFNEIVDDACLDLWAMPSGLGGGAIPIQNMSEIVLTEH